MQQKRESNIDHWETVAVLVSETRQTKENTELGVSLVVNRPVFKNGSQGWPKASLVISRNGASFRLPFHKGESEEIEGIHNLIGLVLQAWSDEGAKEKFEIYQKEHREVIESRRRQEIDNHSQMLDDLAKLEGRDNSRVGTGLARHSKVPKRERRRMKHEHNERERD